MASLLSLVAGGCSAFRPDATCHVREGAEFARLIRFPSKFRMRDPDLKAHWGGDFVYRSSSQGLVVGFDYRGVPSDNWFLIPAENPRSAREATVNEILAAAPLTLQDPYEDSRITHDAHDQLSKERKLPYRGRLLSATGRTSVHGAVQLSRSGRWVALLSINGERGGFNPWGGIANGEYFVEIYDGDSGRRTVAIQGRFDGVTSGTLFHRARWITDRDFAMPLGGRELILCTLPKDTNK